MRSSRLSAGRMRGRVPLVSFIHRLVQASGAPAVLHHSAPEADRLVIRVGRGVRERRNADLNGDPTRTAGSAPPLCHPEWSAQRGVEGSAPPPSADSSTRSARSE